MRQLEAKKNTTGEGQTLSARARRDKVGFDVVTEFQPDSRAMQSAIAFLLGIELDPASLNDDSNENLPVC